MMLAPQRLLPRTQGRHLWVDEAKHKQRKGLVQQAFRIGFWKKYLLYFPPGLALFFSEWNPDEVNQRQCKGLVQQAFRVWFRKGTFCIFRPALFF